MAKPESSSAYLKGETRDSAESTHFTRLRACTEYLNCLTSNFCRIQQVSGKKGMGHARRKTAGLDGLLPHVENRIDEFVSLLVA